MTKNQYVFLGYFCIILSCFLGRGIAQQFISGMGIGFCVISLFKKPTPKE